MSPVKPCMLPLMLLPLLLASCEKPERSVPSPLGDTLGLAGAAAPRIDGGVGAPTALPPAQLAYGSGASVTLPVEPAATGGAGDISLDFAETDVREAAAQVLGNMLKLNYMIDPAVHGTVTLRTTTPLSRAQVLPVLQSLLAQAGATLVQSGSLYRVVPIAAGASPEAAAAGMAGTTVLALHYAAAEDLAKLLQPFAGAGKIAADPGRNALLVSGEPATRDALIALARTFDIDILAGQSYALLPASSGDAKDFAVALQEAFRGQSGGALASVVRVVPMERLNAVLLVSSQVRYIEDARRVYGIVERARRHTVRGWHVYYLQNSPANDVAYVLQQAFTPGNVTAQPSSAGETAPGAATRRIGGMNSTGSGAGMGRGAAGQSFGAGATGSMGAAGAGGLPGATQASGGGASGQGAGQQSTLIASNPLLTNPLLGGLDQNTGSADLSVMRIIADAHNNAILVYGTPQETDTVQAMLRKVDILPLEVRIDATIAEVTLNDALQYGTQFFFRSGGINGVLSNLGQNLSGSSLTAAAFNTTFPGFVIGGAGRGGAPFAISALQQVTTVRVLSSPQLLVLDNQRARLEVGSLVPYLTQTSQSTLLNNAPVINSIDYRQTGVILDVTPRVNSGGLVTLDIAQEVSDVDTNPPTAPGTTISSPTFLDRSVESRVAIQDGQTIGLAGLIRDNTSRGNSGLPWLKDIPILGALAGTQNNQRTRTELLVLITPHVVHDQRDARAFTEDMRDQLLDAALVPQQLNKLRPSGSPDPGAGVRDKIRSKLNFPP